MRLPQGIVNWLVRLSVAALFVGLGLSFRLTLGMKIVTAEKKSARARLAGDELCTRLVLSQCAGGSRDLVSAGRIFTRRMRKGPFSFPVREMVIEDLDLTLSESFFRPPPTNAVARAGAAAPAATTQEGIVNALTKGGGRMRQMMPKVAGLRIRGLSIARIEGGTNAVPWLVSDGGGFDMSGEGVKLGRGFVVEGGKTNRHSEAYLAFKPYLRLYTR